MSADSESERFLHTTAQGHTDILHYLLENMENKDDVNVLDHIHATPAHDAAEYGQMESMLLLLRNGADISIKDTVRHSYRFTIETCNSMSCIQSYNIFVIQYFSTTCLR